MNRHCTCGDVFTEPVEGQPRPWFWLGSGERLCRHCVREAVVLADHHENLYRADVARRIAEMSE